MTLTSRPRGPGFAFGAMALLVLVLLATFALSARQPAPATIAEFAPQAVENITEAPADQSTSRGAGPGTGGGGSTPTAQPSSRASAGVELPRVRRCVGDPPRQIEDPQSPPCVPYWAGDNQGATYKGVTRDEVTVAYPNDEDREGNDVAGLSSFFNRRFELYGRKLTLRPFTCDAGDTPDQFEAAAAQVDEEIKAFGVLGYCDIGAAQSVFYSSIARRRLVSVNNLPGDLLSESDYQRMHPYLWTFTPGEPEMAQVKGRWVCQSLAGRTARFAGPELSSRRRMFGVLNETFNPGGFSADLSKMRAVLAGCGIRAVEKNVDYADATGYANALLDMRREGVTSVICECQGQAFFAPVASGQGYFPEWLIGTYRFQDHEAGPSTWPDDQGAHVFGLSWLNKKLPPQDEPFYWAMRDSDPSYSFPPGASTFTSLYRLYVPLLTMASGVQMAGPRLTPESFAKGLGGTRFPNPSAGAAPYYQAHVGFAEDHTFNDDAAVIWRSTSDRSPWGSARTLCYLRRGQRYLAKFPSDDSGLFEQPCF